MRTSGRANNRHAVEACTVFFRRISYTSLSNDKFARLLTETFDVKLKYKDNVAISHYMTFYILNSLRLKKG